MKKSLILVIVLVIVVIGGFFIYRSSSASSTNISSDGNTKTITLDASRWQYSPNSVTVNKGDHVKIIINNKDTIHGISIPDYGINGIDSVEFIADKVGTFEFYCPTMCGEGHRDMKGTLIVQ